MAKQKNKYYAYYQPNALDIKNKVGDCQIRALTKTLDLTWLEVFDRVIPLCREVQAFTVFCCDLERTKSIMAKLGFEYTGVSNKRGTKRPTVKSFAKDHPAGKYVLKVANHVVACVDGKYYDTWDSGDYSLYGFYELKG